MLGYYSQLLAMFDHAVEERFLKPENRALVPARDVSRVIDKLVIGQSTYFELLWEQLPARQRATLQALAQRGTSEIYSQTAREEFCLGPASSVQKALQSLDARDILNRYRGEFFFLDPLLPCWIRTNAA